MAVRYGHADHEKKKEEQDKKKGSGVEGEERYDSSLRGLSQNGRRIREIHRMQGKREKGPRGSVGVGIVVRGFTFHNQGYDQ